MTTFKYSIGYGGKLYRFSNQSKQALIAEVTAFLNKNNISFDSTDLPKSIDRQSKLVQRKPTIKLADAVSGANAVIRYLNGKSVSYRELERRSDICAQCPISNTIGGCMSCGMAGAITRLTNKIRSSKGVEGKIPSIIANRYCNICGCSLALMVVTKLEDFNSEDNFKNSQRPDVCWLKKTSINYINE